MLLLQSLPCHEFWQTLLKPWKHYVPLAKDLHDLQEKVSWAQAHDGAPSLQRVECSFVLAAHLNHECDLLSKHLSAVEAEVIAEAAAAQAARVLTREAVLDYVAELLSQYTALLQYTVQLHPQAVPISSLETQLQAKPQPPQQQQLQAPVASTEGVLAVDIFAVLRDASGAVAAELEKATSLGDVESAAELCEARERLQTHKEPTAQSVGQTEALHLVPQASLDAKLEAVVEDSLFAYAARYSELDRVLVLRTRCCDDGLPVA